eukprot:29960_1
MSFREKLEDALQSKYGNSISSTFEFYCVTEKLSDEALYYDLTEMSYKWSIMEVFLIDVLLLRNKEGQKIFKYMKQVTADLPCPYSQEEEKQIVSSSNKTMIHETNEDVPSDSPQNESNEDKDDGQATDAHDTEDRKADGETTDDKKADDEDSSSAKKEAKWANLICIVSLNTVFEDWKTYDYSTTDAVKTQNIERKLNHCKDGRGKFKMSGVGTFAYIKKGNPKGYKLAVRCTNNSFPHANDILDQLISGLDAKLETVKKVEKFAKKYKKFLNKTIKTIASV